METEELKELIKKVEDNRATTEEKLKLIHELNVGIEEYNRLLKEAIGKIPQEDK